MKQFCILGLLIMLVMGSGTVQAQTSPKEFEGGSYRVRVTFDHIELRSEQDFYMTVERLDTASSDWNLTVEGVPGLRTSATPIVVKSDFSTTEPTKKIVKMQLPISGDWAIELTLNGTAGRAVIDVPVMVNPPPILPMGVAWLIGLSPIIGLIGFGIGQWRMVVRRRRAERLALN